MPPSPFLAKLLEMIVSAKTISEEQKKNYVLRLRNEGYTKELKEELSSLIQKETAHIDREIAETAAALQEQETRLKEEQQRIQPELLRIEKERREKDAATVAEFDRACDQANQTAERAVEKAVRGEEADEAKAIREGLKKAA